MAAVDLSVEELADLAVSYLSEDLAPIGAFSTNVIGGPGVTEIVKNTASTGGVYQVEVTSALPTPSSNPADYEAMTSGTQTNVSVSTNNLAVMQSLTNVQATQGIPFQTAVQDASKALANDVWDEVTSMLSGASYGSTSIGAAGTLVATDLTTLRAKIEKKDGVSLILEWAESGPVIPTDKDGFDFNSAGAYGFSNWYQTSNFTGGAANTLALAAAKEAAVVVAGLPMNGTLGGTNANRLIETHSLVQQIRLPQIDLPVRMRIWQNSGTLDNFLTLETVFGISEADSTAGEILTHA